MFRDFAQGIVTGGLAKKDVVEEVSEVEKGAAQGVAWERCAIYCAPL